MRLGGTGGRAAGYLGTPGALGTATAAIDTTKTVAPTDLIVAVEGPVGDHCHIG